MTYRELKSYRTARAALEHVSEELAECEVTTAVQSAAQFPYSLHTSTLSGLPTTPRVISLLDEQRRLRAFCGLVERFAESVDDEEMSEIIRLRFLTPERHSWQEIALKLGYRSEHTPKTRLMRYLDNLHKKQQ